MYVVVSIWSTSGAAACCRDSERMLCGDRNWVLSSMVFISRVRRLGFTIDSSECWWWLGRKLCVIMFVFFGWLVRNYFMRAAKLISWVCSSGLTIVMVVSGMSLMSENVCSCMW